MGCVAAERVCWALTEGCRGLGGDELGAPAREDCVGHNKDFVSCSFCDMEPSGWL